MRIYRLAIDDTGHSRSAAQAALVRAVDEGTSTRHRQQGGRPSHLVDTFGAMVGGM
jgi:hypothetical protein